MEDKIALRFNRDPEIARLIWDTAIWQARSKPPKVPDETDPSGYRNTNAADLKVQPEDIRDAANLVFLIMDLIEEWQTRKAGN